MVCQSWPVSIPHRRRVPAITCLAVETAVSVPKERCAMCMALAWTPVSVRLIARVSNAVGMAAAAVAVSAERNSFAGLIFDARR